MATAQLKDLKFNSPVLTNAAGQLEGNFNVGSSGFSMSGVGGTIRGFSLNDCNLYGGNIDGWFGVGSGLTFGCGRTTLAEVETCGWYNSSGNYGPSGSLSYFGMIPYTVEGKTYFVPAFSAS